MIVSSGTKKPKIHSSAYVAPSATIAGDVTVGAGSAILHGAVIVAEGAAVTIGSETVVMENAVLKASGGSALQFPLAIGDRCIVGPHAYVVGATIGNGCFVASGAKVFNGARLEEGSGVALGGVVHVNARLPKGSSVPMQHIALGDPATIYPPDRAAEVQAKMNFYADVFNVEGGEGARARAAQTYSKFLRKTHAQDKALDEHKNAAPPPRRTGEEPPPTQAADVGGVVDAMMLELQEMEHRRQEA
ncbi:MAG TPA: gamma carbonic anhydrase family protein, partial [Verrucomicrobiae bacterium]|nr:gamma carbonic anhydrase family protein [Verrucomicrobiae bacterium]